LPFAALRAAAGLTRSYSFADSVPFLRLGRSASRATFVVTAYGLLRSRSCS